MKRLHTKAQAKAAAERGGDPIDGRRVIKSFHQPRQYGITRRPEWEVLRAHLRDEHGVNLGRPKPWRSLMDSYNLQRDHDALHPEIKRVKP